LQEVYPIDAILARELGISDSVVTFHATRQKDPIYTFEARDAAGDLILRETFDPHYVVRPFFDLFPEYEQVRVTTGWITAASGGETLLDQRIVTDPERFWDRLQTETYGEIIAYVMDSQDGDPSGDNAPFFDEFRVDLRLSEPDYRIGVDEETISSLEALHEDLYFETHTLFTLLGGRYQTSLSNPGRVLPFVDPSGAGKPGKARLSLTGKERGNPKLVVRSWTLESSEPKLQEYELTPLPVEDPGLVGATLADGEEGIRQLMVRVTVPDSLDRYEEFAARSSESGIDREFLNVEILEGMLRSLQNLHEAGLMEEALSWDRVQELALDFRLEKDSIYQKTAVLPRSRNPKSTDNPRLTAGGWTHGGEAMVQWDTPISLEENEALLGKLGTFPGVDVYYLTNSFLGNRVWAADFLPPHDAKYVSQAKLNALKPTLFVSGREHANEVSSTSHILKLGELLVTDSSYREMLNKVNVVLHPITNPDGAALAYARQLVNPDHMLHAGRPGALGSDATSGGSTDDPIYPESKAREMIREAWLPDIYLNPHGYPSHEWVQYFAGYSAWARGRRVGPRTWWVPRGWFIPGFSWVEDEENPDYGTAQFAILDSMAAAMTGNQDVDAVNRRVYARYKKYGEQERDGFTEYFHNGMVVSMRLRGTESIGTGLNSPRITYFSITTEAPDETARGIYMDLMGQAGLAHTTSALRYLATGEFKVEREAEAFDAVV
ncbi:MAG: M14 family metallopeptidase, partial [Longimicrobiales bacterium]|nr:M14 family metallopeptidase [Longimicrobiales bacterium]